MLLLKYCVVVCVWCMSSLVFRLLAVIVAAVVEVVLLFATGLLSTIDESSTGDWACWFEGGRVDPFGSNQTKTFITNQIKSLKKLKSY